MGLTMISHEIQDRLSDNLPGFSWQRAVAAGSLVAGACLFLAGHRRTALVVGAAGVTVGMLEYPETAREIWESLPKYLRKGQDALMRIEDFLNEVAKQGSKLRSTLG